MIGTTSTQNLFIVAPLNARFQFGEAAPMPQHNGVAEAAPVAATVTAQDETVLVRPRGLALPRGA